MLISHKITQLIQDNKQLLIKIFHKILLSFYLKYSNEKKIAFLKYFLNQNANIKAHPQTFQNPMKSIKSHNYNPLLVFFHYLNFFSPN